MNSSALATPTLVRSFFVWNSATAAILVLSAFDGVATAAPTSSTTPPCAMSTQFADQACRLAGQADQALADGMCVNLTDAAAQKQCFNSAKAVLSKSDQACALQLASRNKICQAVGFGPYDPQIDPSAFGRPITNPLLPMIPGTTFTYRVPGGVNTVAVLHATARIDGVDCVEVEDNVIIDGAVEEHTIDYFTQDQAGNVWYFGEATQENKNGQVTSILGSWLAGVNRARPGIIMKAHPTPGQAYRQEFSLGVAEDAAEVISFGNVVSVPFGSFSNAMKTLEFTGLEPGARENKYYAPGVGNVLVVDLVSGEHDELISVTHD
jgi:hypothetical protein